MIGTANINEAVARPVRGLAQGGAGYVVVDVLDQFTRWNPTTQQYGLAVIVLSGLISALQNFAENKGWIKAFLRKVPPTEVPVING